MYKLLSLGLFICFSLTVITGCSQTPKSTESSTTETKAYVHEVLELDTYMTQIKAETRPHHFVDVRTPEEVADGTIDNAINIDYKAEGFMDKMTGLDKNQPVYLFCRSGNRSGKAAKLLIDAGYTEIYDLKGGYLKYSEGK